MVSGKIRIAAHVEVTWVQGEAVARCPNCGAKEPAWRLLEIDYRPPGDAHHFVLQVCGRCGARFPDNPETMDYSSDELIEIGWHTYQVQLGAGVWPITAPLTRIDKPAGARMLEIGGAYGFGLDFGIRARGWNGRGYDPSPLAEFGARELGLDIAQAYFGADDLAGGAYDVVLATEVVEHLADPPAFFRLMRAAVGTDGVLLLTTPDAAWITPELAPAALMPLLSPGAHVVLQTAESLEFALRRAGFAQVRVTREAMSLIAYASPAPFALLEDFMAGRGLYRRYLVERAETAAATSDLRLGFAGRGLFEAANDGDAGPAASAWAALLPAVRARFGIDLDTIESLPAATAGASLAALGQIMPLGLGMILFGRAMQRLGAGEARGALLPLFRLAVQAIDALQGALAQRSLGDGLSADLRKAAEVEILICQADAGDPEAVAPLAALAAEPGQVIAAWRGLVGLVNAGAYEAATTLKDALGLDEPDGLPADLRRDALMSLANLALAPGGATPRAFGYATALREMGEPADEICLQAFTRLVNAGENEAARGAAAGHDVEAMIARGGGTAARDARLAFVMLDFSAGATEAALARLVPLLRAEGEAVVDRLYVDGFVRLINEGRYGPARQLAAGQAVEKRLADCPAPLREDALGALLLLEVQPGGNAGRVPERVAALVAAGLPEERLRGPLFAAFVTLVNGGEASAARRLLPLVLPELARLRQPYEPGERDALFAYGVLSSQERHELTAGAASLARLRDDICKRTPAGAAPDALFWPALRGEILSLQMLDRAEEASGLLDELIRKYPGAPEDLVVLVGQPE